MMNHYLLLGAGFSRNWGGWLASEAFEYLLGCPEIHANRYIRDQLWRTKDQGGFEGALSQLQSERDRIADATAQGNYKTIERCVSQMFKDMNQQFLNMPSMEFQHGDYSRQIRPFLDRFDCIFTLNQDLLLEHHHMGPVINPPADRTHRPYFPGMERQTHVDGTKHVWSQVTWGPKPLSEFQLEDGSQPIFKLHGSSNWLDGNGGELLIVGGNKQGSLGKIPVLNWYFEQFTERLTRSPARLMTIGYGFRDDHVNEVITKGIEGGSLRLFVIDPHGPDLALSLNKTKTGKASIAVDTDLEAVFRQGLIGASRRGLQEIFGEDSIEHTKIMRFFEASIQTR